VVNALRTATGISLDRHAIHMTEHLKEVGAATVTAALYDGVDATIKVEITAVVHEFLKYTHAETFVSACAAYAAYVTAR